MESTAESIARLQEEAAEVAREVSRRLDAGASPDALVSRLRRQLELVDAVRQGIETLAASGDGAAAEELRAGARKLAELSEANHVQATRKGIRLTPTRRPVRTAPRPPRGKET